VTATVLTEAQARLLARTVAALQVVPGVTALVLGGSHARGRARSDSDLDIGVCYRATSPLDIESVRAVAVALNDAPDPVVSDLGGWGRFVDGGAWLTIEGQRIDFLYRNLDQVQSVLADAREGRFELDWAQQPPFGFFGPTILGEMSIARPLHDPEGAIAALKAEIDPMPEALVQSVVQANLWQVDFGLRAFAPKFAAAGNAYGLAGCLTRFANALVLTLFMLNRTWFLNDKTALAEIEGFALAPPAFALRLQALLGSVGQDCDAQATSLAACEALFHETAVLAGALYRPTWRF
jgi:predicted nucleotidyltransferase